MKNNIKKEVKKVANKKGMSTGKKVAIGAGIAAVGAGAYYLLGPNAKAHQKKALDLAKKMEKEVLAETKKVKNVSTNLYHSVVDKISKGYTKQHKVHEKDIKAVAKKLKGEWKSIAKKVK